MTINKRNKKVNTVLKSTLLSSVALLFMTGCVGGKQIIVPTYLAPKEASKVKGIMEDNGDKKGKFISLAIDPKVKTEVQIQDALKKRIVNITKETITESNYILLHPIYSVSQNGLSLHVTNYSFKKSCEKDACYLDSQMELSFNISRGSVDYYTKNYNSSKQRQSEKRSQHLLPNEMEISAELIKDCVEQFISDISPQKTNQLRELKPLPSEIAYLLDMAPAGNYQEIIAKMEKYKGDKDMSYYYDLAVFYEALAAKNEELGLLEKANINYEKALSKGGSTDEVVVKTKARFDKFYDVFKKLAQQRSSNKKQEQSINDEYNIKE